MASNDEFDFLSEPKARIRRDGVLSKEQVSAALTAYLKNATDLMDDAIVIFNGPRPSRSVALAILGLEELAKVPLLVNTFLAYESGQDKNAWASYWKTGGSHRSKQDAIGSYGALIRPLFEEDPIFRRKLYSLYASESLFSKLDVLKQSFFYVDIRDDGVHEPEFTSNSLNILDFILAFGRERADSFSSWHITQRRSIDYLEVATGITPHSNWTNSFRVEEVEADILYHANFHSASVVPDYVSFIDFIESYKSKPSEKYFTNSIFSLSTRILDRVNSTQGLPRLHARSLWLLKMLIRLSMEDAPLRPSMRKKLREQLLPKTTKRDDGTPA